MQSKIHTITLFLIAFLLSCNENPTLKHQLFTIDSTMTNVVMNKIFDGTGNTHSYYFKTHLKKLSYSNDTLEREIDTLWAMESYYTWKNDTLFLITHTSDFTTNALLAKIYKDTASVYLLKCAHIKPFFKLNLKDTRSVCIEVPCPEYRFIVSEIPDSTQKLPMNGYVKFVTQNYYYVDTKGDSVDEFNKLKTQMEFYFRSTYRKVEL